MRDKILTFMELTGMPKLIEALIDNVTGEFKKGFEQGFGEALPESPSKALQVVREALLSGRSQLVDEIIAIYEKTFDESEMDDVIRFYRSPTGKKLNDVGSSLMMQIQELTTKWSSDRVKTVETDLAKLLS